MPEPTMSDVGLKLLRRDTVPDLLTVATAATGNYTLRVAVDGVDYDCTYAATVPTDTVTDIRDGVIAGAPAGLAAAGVRLVSSSTDEIHVTGLDVEFTSAIQAEPSPGDMTLAKVSSAVGDLDYSALQSAPGPYADLPYKRQDRLVAVSGIEARLALFDSAGDALAPGSMTYSLDILDAQPISGKTAVTKLLASTGLVPFVAVTRTPVPGGTRMAVRIHTLANVPATAVTMELQFREL